MSSVTPISPPDEATPLTPPPALAGRWAASLDWLERMGERLNPILVKECRQALKSRQFSITFLLVLATCWIWSIFGVQSIGPNIYYSGGQAGVSMFVGYFIILAVALLLVVPFGAFRSLADERDDRTFELLAITTLRPRQIISGKLGSAMVQMLIYLSAVSPCLGFTYLLGGIELPTILLAIGFLVLMSIGLSILGLLAGTLALSRQWYALWSAVVVLALIGNLFATLSLAIEAVIFAPMRLTYGSADFWHAVGAFVLTHLSYDVLLFLAAAARLTFPSENRSTPLRIAMLSQHLLLTFFVAWTIARFHTEGPWILALSRSLPVYCGLLTANWFVMGAFLTGEVSRLSERAKRGLPQSMLGRALGSWFLPGSATGYMFIVGNLLGMLALVHGVMLYLSFDPAMSAQLATAGPGWGTLGTVSMYCVVPVCYAVIYLGLVRLTIGWLRRTTLGRISGSVPLTVVFVLIGCVVPAVIEEVTGARRYAYMSEPNPLLFISNPFVTLRDLHSLSITGRDSLVQLVLVGTAAIVFVLNLRGVAAELRQTRVAPPQRVTQDDAALAAAMKPAPPADPWDEPDQPG